MWQQSREESDESLFVAGQRVPAGIYREIHSNREVRLEEEDALPASFDGQVACYVRVPITWTQIKQPPAGIA